MKHLRITPFATGLIVGFVLLGAFAFTVSGLAGNNGVWHLIDDVSRDAAGTVSFLPIQFSDVNPAEVCAKNPANGTTTAACPTGSGSSTIDLVNVLRPSGVSVDVDDDGQIDLIDGDTVNTNKILNGTIAKVDVNPNEICVHNGGVPSAGCGAAPQFTCVKVYGANGSGIVNIPAKCGNADNPSQHSGACTIMMTLHNATAPPILNPLEFAHVMYAQFEPTSSLGGDARWSALKIIEGQCPGPNTVSQGSNGDSGATVIAEFCGTPVKNIYLQDDGPGDSSTAQWYLTDTDASYYVSVWVC